MTEGNHDERWATSAHGNYDKVNRPRMATHLAPLAKQRSSKSPSFACTHHSR